MTKGMGRDGLLDTSLLGIFLYHDEDHRTGEMGSTTIQEDVILFSFFNIHQSAVIKPVAQLLDRLL